jgi:hypothetical protein
MKTRLPQKLSATLLGLACACAAGFNATVHAQHVPNGTNEIAFADFDLAIPSWDYGYFYSDGNIGGGYSQNRFFVDPPEYTNIVFRYTFDSSVFAGFSSWWGTGFGMPLPWVNDALAFNSLDLADYILSFDARVEGLNPGQATGNCDMEFRLGTPGAPAWALVKQLRYNPGSNWTHYVFHLDQGNYIGADGQPQTSYTTFTNGIAIGITEVRFNQNQPNPTEFGPDADNAIYIDNVKLEVLEYAGPPPPPPPTVPLTILDWNLDDKAGWGYFGGYNWSANSYLPTFTYSATNGVGVGGSNGWILTMDNSALVAPNTPAWSGGGTGGSGPVDYTRFASGDLKAYQISFDSRAEGLNPSKTDSTTLRLQLFLDSPNGNMRIDFNVPAGSNWVTTTYLLNDGSFGIGSKAMFATNYNTITALRTQWQIENSSSESDWAFDADNSLIVDNIKLAYNIVGCPPVTVTPSGNNVVLSWPALNTLGYAQVQKATTVTGPYSDVTGATNSPVPLPASGATGFFRTKWVPPTQ